jgi:hypothetical protein
LYLESSLKDLPLTLIYTTLAEYFLSLALWVRLIAQKEYLLSTSIVFSLHTWWYDSLNLLV